MSLSLLITQGVRLLKKEIEVGKVSAEFEWVLRIKCGCGAITTCGHRYQYSAHCEGDKNSATVGKCGAMYRLWSGGLVGMCE
jgi:hypothetical protein